MPYVSKITVEQKQQMLQWASEGVAITEIVKLAIARGTGARGLRPIVEEALDQVMFELPDYEIHHNWNLSLNRLHF